MVAPEWGHFPAHPQLELVDTQLARLRAPFAFVRRTGDVWTAPEGMLFDGTSIPAALWSTFRESPFTGHAAWSAIVHDAGCKGRVLVNGLLREQAGFRDPEVHLAFYEGIRAAGGSPLKAWAFYRTVWTVGMLRGGRST